MKKQIKKLIALLLTICMSLAYLPMTIKADDTTDRVLTSEDIPDEYLYSLMLAHGDFDGDGELLLSEAKCINYIEIQEPVSSFKGLELIDRVRIVMSGYTDNPLTQSETELMLEGIQDFSNINSLSIEGIFLNEEMFETITKMPLEIFYAEFEEVSDFSFIKQTDISDKPFYESVKSLTLFYPVNADIAEFSLEYLEACSNLTELCLMGNIKITDIDKISLYENLTELTLDCYYSNGAEIDLSSNTNLTTVSVSNRNDEKVPVTVGENGNIVTLELGNVEFTESPADCKILSIYNSSLGTTKLDFSEYENLEELSVAKCGIDEVTGLDKCSKLNSLALGKNNLTKVPQLPDSDMWYLDLSNNNLTKEELLANAPERFSSDIRWLLENLTIKFFSIEKVEFSNVYTEFNTEYFEAVLEQYDDDGYIYESWYTNCNEIVLEKSLLEMAADRTGTTIFMFNYRDEAGNMAAAEVDLKDALETLDGDCVINFGFAKDENAVNIWGTDNVYAGLHNKYGIYNNYISGVKYNLSASLYNAYNIYIYTDTIVPYKYGANESDIRIMFENGELSENTYYYIPIGADPNYIFTSEEGVNSGKQITCEVDSMWWGIPDDTLYNMEDGSTINISDNAYITKENWNLMISKKMNLNIYLTNFSNLYIDGIVKLTYEDMVSIPEDVDSGAELYYYYDMYEDDELSRKFLLAISAAGLQLIDDNVDIEWYVGDIAKNKETVCEIEPFCSYYVSTDKQREAKYEIINSYTVDSGMIEFEYQNGTSIVVRNKNNIGPYSELSVISGDITYYEDGEKIVSLTNHTVDNIDLRGCADAFTITAECTLDSADTYPSGSIFGLENRTGDENYYIYLNANGDALNLTVCNGEYYTLMVYPFNLISMSADKVHYINTVVEKDDDILYITLYFDGTEIEVADLSNATSGNATKGNATNKNATSGNADYYGTGVADFDLSKLNTIYCNEESVNGSWYYEDNDSINLTVYAGNIFEETNESDDTDEGSGDESDEGSNNDESAKGDESDNGSENDESGEGTENDTTDKDDIYEEPEHVDEEDIVDSDKAVDVIIEDMKENDEKTVEVISSNPQEIGKDVFETMVEEDKNFVYGVTDENNDLMYSWSFASKYIDNPKMNMDLGIEISEHHNKVDKKIDNKDALYINFKHHGELPGPATVKVYVGDKYRKNEKVYLYYDDENNDKVLRVGKEPLRVQEGGYIEFTISHCSTYFVIEEEKAVEFNEEFNIEFDENSFENVNFNIIRLADTDAEAGDTFSRGTLLVVVFLGISSLSAFMVALNQQNKKRKNIICK